MIKSPILILDFYKIFMKCYFDIERENIKPFIKNEYTEQELRFEYPKNIFFSILKMERTLESGIFNPSTASTNNRLYEIMNRVHITFSKFLCRNDMPYILSTDFKEYFVNIYNEYLIDFYPFNN